MPIVRRFGKVRLSDFEELNGAQRAQLEHGQCLPYLRDKGYQSIEELRIGWEIHGDALTQDFAEMHPGCRCFGWWVDHGEERPIVCHCDADDCIERSCREAHFGFLHSSVGIPVCSVLQPWQEQEHTYLRRHRLLTAQELSHPNLDSEAL
jgi:hypothetical protein